MSVDLSLKKDYLLQGTSTKSLSSSKTSRISLVDLAGSDGNKLNEADRQYTKEGRQVHKSLSSLGYDFDDMTHYHISLFLLHAFSNRLNGYCS